MAEAKPAAKRERRPRLGRPGQGCSSPSVVFTGFSAKVTTEIASVPVLPSISRLCSSISPLRSWSWLETQRGTTRRPASFPVTCSWRCARRGAEQTPGPSNHRSGRRAAPTSRPCCCPRRARNPPKPSNWSPGLLLQHKGSFQSHTLHLIESAFCISLFYS